MIRENPEILREFVNEKQEVKTIDSKDRPTEGRFMKFTPRQKERIEALASPRKQAELIRQAVDIGLPVLEKEISERC